MHRQRSGLLASALVSLCGVALVGGGLLGGDTTTVVIGASVMSMAGGAMAALSTTDEN